MVAQVEFFCSPVEEAQVLRYLKTSGDIAAFPLGLHSPSAVPTIDLSRPPAWPEPFDICLWLRDAGAIEWHTERPRVDGATHGEIVNRLFAAEAWDVLDPQEGRGLIDVDRSPILFYRRALVRDGQIGPCLLLSRATNAERVSPAFAKWVKRALSWVRRHSTLVHDWRRQNSHLPNPYSIVNSLYAFPDALAELESGTHRFAILR